MFHGYTIVISQVVKILNWTKVEDRRNINLEGTKDCYIYIVARYNVIVKHRSNTIVLINANNYSPYDILAFGIKNKTEIQYGRFQNNK